MKASANLRSIRSVLSNSAGGGMRKLFPANSKSVNLELKFKRTGSSVGGPLVSSIMLHLDYDYLPLIRPKLRNATTTTAAQVNTIRPTSEELMRATHETNIELSQVLVDMLQMRKDFDLFVTIICLVSSIWSLIKCYNIQRFQGIIKLDIYSLFLFLIIGCDIIANLILGATLSFGLYLFMIRSRTLARALSAR